ncbi:hypothetical protein Leryth_010501, partial [Lithospermum erythrorhizon]
PPPKQPPFPITPQLTPKAKIFLQILKKIQPLHLNSELTNTQINPVPELVQEVLKHSYESPSAAIQFFKWACLIHKQDEYCWTLMVDLLGKNEMFDVMWDAIRSMKEDGFLSVDTFVLVFGSYCVAGRAGEAIMSFDVMERYGVQTNQFAVNALLSAICREDNQTTKAFEFFERIKTKISPDADSFTILLEGWEKEGNTAKAKSTFGEMAIRIGWSPQNTPAYDAFLNTLVCGSEVDDAVKFLQLMKGKNCFPSLKFFSNALDVLDKKHDAARAISLWDLMQSSGLIPNLPMYNSMIGLFCKNNAIDDAFHLLDEMVFQGAFPDSSTYNMIFKCLVKNKKVHETGKFFVEMTKNEFPPTSLNCAAAISMLFDNDDPETPVEIWDFMVNNLVLPLQDSANALLVGLCNLNRLTDFNRFAEDMLDRRIEIYESTMEKLKSACHKREGRKSTRDVYDSLEKKWKSSKNI